MGEPLSRDKIESLLVEMITIDRGCVTFTFEFYGVHRVKSEVNRRCTTVQNSDDLIRPSH